MTGRRIASLLIGAIAGAALLVAAGVVVVCAGGGGIPVARDAAGAWRGVEAVVDKDLSTALLASALHADVLLLLTAVDAVYADWPEPARRPIARIDPARLRTLRFEPGSMGPKVEAACRFVEAGGARAAIGALGAAERLLRNADGQVSPLGSKVRGAADAARVTLETARIVLLDAQKLLRNVDGQVAPLVGNANETLTAARGTLSQANKSLVKLTDTASPALKQAEQTLTGANTMIHQDLAQTLRALEEALRAIRALAPQTPGATLDVSGGFNRPPMERAPGVVRLFETAKACAAEIGLALAEGATGGGSDGNFTAALGIPTLDGLGATGDGAHALHEHVEVAELPRRAAVIAGLLYHLTRNG